MRTLLVGIVGWTVIVALPAAARARYWQDASGKKVFSGELIGLKGDEAVILEMRGVRTWKLSDLSEADRLYLAKFAEQEKEWAGKTDRERIQGAWGVVYQRTGTRGMGTSTPRLAYVFEDELVRMPRSGQQKFVLRPEATPAEINLGGSFGDQPVEGIYAFVGERLVIARSPPGIARPAGFQMRPESPVLIQILRRVDEEAAKRLIQGPPGVPRRPGFPRPPLPFRP
jgi:uncharacterized protein (TIGR03067 family)